MRRRKRMVGERGRKESGREERKEQRENERS